MLTYNAFVALTNNEINPYNASVALSNTIYMYVQNPNRILDWAYNWVVSSYYRQLCAVLAVKPWA